MGAAFRTQHSQSRQKENCLAKPFGGYGFFGGWATVWRQKVLRLPGKCEESLLERNKLSGNGALSTIVVKVVQGRVHLKGNVYLCFTI
jgi:hypothetical protein